MNTVLAAILRRAAVGKWLACAVVGAATLVVQAAPSGPLPCDGTFGSGGCAPYTQIQYFDGTYPGSNLFEYQPIPLDVSAAGAFGTVRGQADLRSGELKVFGRSFNDGNPSTANGVMVAVGASDVFTLHRSGPLPDIVQFSIILEADGVGASDLFGYGGGALISFGGPSLGVLPGSVPYDQRTFQAGVGGLPVFTDYPIHLFAFANIAMPADVPFELDTYLRADVSEASYMDLSHTAHLRFVLPEGVSITSMGGYAASVTAVPEPSTWALLTAGLMIGARLARRRGDPPV